MLIGYLLARGYLLQRRLFENLIRLPDLSAVRSPPTGWQFAEGNNIYILQQYEVMDGNESTPPSLSLKQ